MPVIPPPVGVNRPPTVVGLPPSQRQGQVVVPPNPGRLAVIGGLYAAKRAAVTPPPEGVTLYRPAFEWSGMLALTGGAGSPPDDAPRPWHFPDRMNPAPPPQWADDTDWLPWVLGSGAVLAVLTGVYAAVRPRGGRVRVTGVPPGEAPAWVRQAWVGVELPTVRREPRAVPAFQVLSRSHADAGSGYEVSGSAAVAAVAVANPDAADWWRANVPEVLAPGYLLIFPADVCERVG
jgi:hypothetical protein